MKTTRHQKLTFDYSTELAVIDVRLADELTKAAIAIDDILHEEDFAIWLKAGIQVARNLPDTPWVGVTYFRNSEEILHVSDPITLIRCADIALDLAHRSTDLAIAFLMAAPSFLSCRKSIDLISWTAMGSQLCTDSWKSIALASLYFEYSHQLLKSTSAASFEQLLVVITELSRQSLEMASICLREAASILASLPEIHHLSFLNMAGVIVKNNWSNAWLYFEQGPGLLKQFTSSETTAFLLLIIAIIKDGCQEPFLLFEELCVAVGQIDTSEREELRQLAQQLVNISSSATAEFLKSAPTVRVRIPPTAMQQWVSLGLQSSGAEHSFAGGNDEQLATYFRMQSVTAERAVAQLSGRVDFEQSANLLRLYGQALAGEKVRVQPVSQLVNRGLGWSPDKKPATEGTAIYVPPYIDLCADQTGNLQIYKVCIAHQAGRIGFGTFDFRYGENGRYLTSTVAIRERNNTSDAITPVQKFFDLFQSRSLIEGLFSIVEDYRVDSCIQSEYPGLRKWISRTKTYEATIRPNLPDLGLRQVFSENLLRASLGDWDSMRWPAGLKAIIVSALGALQIVSKTGSTVQDTSEIAAHLYDLAIDIPNIPANRLEDDWIEIGDQDLPDSITRPDVSSILKANDLHGITELQYKNPQSPEFYGDLKPELVQTLNELRDSLGEEKPTPEQLQAMLDNSIEVENADADSIIEQLELENSTLFVAADGELGAEDENLSVADTEEIISWATYDEWDFRANDYLNSWCLLGERLIAEGNITYYEQTLQRNSGLVNNIRRQFELMRPESQRKLKNLDDGQEIDLDKAIRFFIEKKAGVGPRARFYTRRDKIERSVAVAFLLDMSGSTDEPISNLNRTSGIDHRSNPVSIEAKSSEKKIIDLEKETAVLIIEALEAIGDQYGIYGFSGYGRKDVSYHIIKELDQELDDAVKKRIDSIKPLRSTRMGAAIRHTNARLLECTAKVRILMLISDGRPQDQGYGHNRDDQEYAIHDTKQALIEGKQEGIVPFLITVDEEGHDYLNEICGDIGYEVVSDIESLPQRLPTIYSYLATK